MKESAPKELPYADALLSRSSPWGKTPRSRQLGHMTETGTHRALARLCGSPQSWTGNCSLMHCDRNALTHTQHLYDKTLLTTQWYHSGFVQDLTRRKTESVKHNLSCQSQFLPCVAQCVDTEGSIQKCWLTDTMWQTNTHGAERFIGKYGLSNVHNIQCVQCVMVQCRW